MTLALILMWIPSPLQALLKVWRSLVQLLTHIDRHLDDPLPVPELRDTPEGRAGFQRGLRVAEGMVAILVALRTRELLGLSLKLPGRYVSPPAPAKPLSWRELLQRYQRLRGSLARIERTAQRRANRIAREMASNPFASCPLVSLDCAKVVAGETPAAPWAFEGRTKHGARPRAFVS
ncbi:hypothetical protein [uncultured Amaricoccus sp.]|uniref:hypothetical protein n=1 Tax=uncultured Amaricoccus sp. TaxID=339341 RepID=UPI0026112800|nr:hypothetical protein [uncultured Amaricoccus sp.]